MQLIITTPKKGRKKGRRALSRESVKTLITLFREMTEEEQEDVKRQLLAIFRRIKLKTVRRPTLQ